MAPIAECDVLSVNLADSNLKSLKSLIKMLGNSRSSINFASGPKCDYQSLKRVAGQHKCDNDTAPQFYLSHSQVARTFRELPIRLQLRLSVGHRNPHDPIRHTVLASLFSLRAPDATISSACRKMVGPSTESRRRKKGANKSNGH